MRVLLTGCAGFVGCHLAKRLLSLGYTVVGLDALDETLYPAAQHRAHLAPLLSHPRFQFTEGDILSSELVSALCEDVSVVLHLAALAGVRPSLTQATRYLRVNVEGTQNILDACRKHEISRVVFASSSSVYGAHSQVPFREDDPVARPASPYAASKLAGELLLSTHADLYGGNLFALRFFTVYGPHQRPEMAIANFSARMLSEQPISLFGTGESARDYTYIDDILDGIVAALDRTSVSSQCFRAYNLGNHHPTPLRELVSHLEAALGCKARIEWHPDQPGDVPVTCASLDRSFGELGYSPKINLAEGLARFAEHCRAKVASGQTDG
ncbi:MAG TPA: NAD-dependent epimerase/dehydratase family protein [Pseudomonadota bacterium]|nr:NAD-dependent epimerase/dehydratase family protein [Pseudomonadota bacterium]